MVFTEISALVQSQWQLLRGVFDAEGHERRVQQRQEKKQAKQQRKAARRVARQARRSQRKQRHQQQQQQPLSPTLVGEPTDDEERPEASTSPISTDKCPEIAVVPLGPGGLAWACTAEALTVVASANDTAAFFKSEPSERRRDTPQETSPESVAAEAGYEKADVATAAVAKAVGAAPQVPMELALALEAQLEQKQREFYDSLGGYSTVDEEEDELHELLADGRRSSDSKLPPKWTAAGIKKAGALAQTSEKVFLKVIEATEQEEDASMSLKASSTKPKRPKTLSSSSTLVETEPEDDEVDLRDSDAFDGYSTFDEEGEEERDIFIADHEFDGLCAPPSSSSATGNRTDAGASFEAKVDTAGAEVEVEPEQVVEDKTEVSIELEELETKQSPMTHFHFSDEEMEVAELLDAKDKLSEEEPAETESEEEQVEMFKVVEEVTEVEVEMMEIPEEIKVVAEVIIEEFEEALHLVDEDMFGQQSRLLSLDLQPSEQSSLATPGVYSPGTVDEYACSIYENLRAREHRYHVTEDIFSKQQSVSPKMRTVLVDWLVEVHQRFELETQTLYLTVNYIDRYLAQAPVKSQRFQLVGVAALLIASKFEEIYPCDTDDLLYICERSYSKADLVDCERNLLNAFKFNLAVPSVSSFLSYYLNQFEEEDELIGQLAGFFAECSLLDFTFGSTYEPSLIACACLLAAYCYIENQTPALVWNYRLVELTGYAVEALVPCARDLWSILIQPSDLTATATKYSTKEFGEVAHLPLEDLRALLC